MSTTKDDSKKNSTVPKERTSKNSTSKRESSTDRANNKKKKEPHKTKDITSSLFKISEENDKPKKSSISTKVPSKAEKPLMTSLANITSKPSKKESLPSSRNVLSKSEKERPTISTKISSKQEKVSSSTSKKTSSKTDKVSSVTTSKPSSRSTLDITKPARISKTSTARDLVNREVSSTPSSSGIKKTQYFPSKNLYSNALKHTDVPEGHGEENASFTRKEKHPIKKEKDKNVSKVIKSGPTDSSKSVRSVIMNVKESFLKESSSKIDRDNNNIRSVKDISGDVAVRESSPDTSSVSERPRTATLRKGSIVNTNIVGPEAPRSSKDALIKEHLLVKEISSTLKQKIASPPNSDDNYEDDFESYESDFEAYSSSEDNTNLAKISGEETSSVSSSSEDIPEKQDFAFTNLEIEKKKIVAAPTEEDKTHDSGTFELPDFKHKRILDQIKESVDKESAILQEAKHNEKANLSFLSDEGFEDQQSLQFINFADARKKCEKRRASELRKKRGEEILGMIKLDNVSFTIFDSPAVPYDVFISSYGQNNTVQASAQTRDDDVSDEMQTEAIEVQTRWTQMPIHFSSLDQTEENFWINYKKEYLGVGNDSLDENLLNNDANINDKRLGYFLSQSIDLISDILAEANMGNLNKLTRNERDIPFSDGYLEFNTSKDIFKNSKVQNISVFSRNVNHILTVHLKIGNSEDIIKSIVSVWDISDFNAPRTIFVSYGEVCCATFSLEASEYIFAGQNDGAILVWNIKEKSQIYEIMSRTPTVTSDIGLSHFAKVVSIQPIRDDEEHKSYFNVNENKEICSLDEDGDIIIWTLYTDYECKKSTTSGIVLINTVSISLQKLHPEFPDLLCTELILMGKHLYVSTSYGFILHCLLNVNGRNVKKFVPATTIDSTCLEACPFSSSFFLAGYSNGNITLYSKNTERPLMVLRNNEEIVNTSIQIIQWSKTKPFVLYAKDSQNTIHIWNLSKSDMYPEYSIPFKENISCLKLSPVINIEEEDTSYMLIGTEEGKVYLHLLNKEYGQDSYELYKNHVATFLNYVGRL